MKLHHGRSQTGGGVHLGQLRINEQAHQMCIRDRSERLEGEVPQAMAEDSETSLLQDFFQQLQRQNMSFDTYLMPVSYTHLDVYKRQHGLC